MLFILSITIGFLSLQTFAGKGLFILNQKNIYYLLIVNLILFAILLVAVCLKIYETLQKKNRNEIGYDTSKNLLTYFLFISSIPSILIALFSLLTFNFTIEKWFDQKISTIVDNSRNIAQNYLADQQQSVLKDLILISNDLNRNKKALQNSKNNFLNYLNLQSNIREVENVYIIDSKSNLFLKNSISQNYTPPSRENILLATNGKPFILSDAFEKKTIGLLKLNNFEDLYLYLVKLDDPKIVSFLKQTGDASTYYSTVRNDTVKIQTTFFIVYLIFTLLLIMSSALIAINLANKTTKPLNQIFQAAKKIVSGDYKIKFSKTKNEDFSILNSAFEDMAKQIELQKKKDILSGRLEAWQVIARKLAHEIKNPLTPIQLSLDRIKQKSLKMEPGTDIKDHLEVINNQIHQITNLVNSFSDFARMSKPVLEQNNLEKILSDAINVYKLNYNNINFEFNYKTNKNIIFCDKDQISRALVNLYKNSLEALEEKNSKIKNIFTTVYFADPYFIINIKDNAGGFKNLDKKIEEPYYTTKKNGSGLGLSVVSKIIHEHNGDIDYKNSDDGTGAEIIIKIPSNE